ncbi:hypothetical protein WR25_11284 [Diploscapter pachys]|uniref:DUF7087 domain-containing protein n=1 Tax=Diploscapter pachys TaxID=2018661 RepID=A0A2A2KAY6_9BILA|nr:hypothetical protein WR25_11284 [Diploscapter pachys]
MNYDFPTAVNTSRLVQIVCVILQLLLVYSESASLSFTAFMFYSLLLGCNLVHILRRWYGSIDGRYDLKQLMREPQMTVKVQYAVALFTGILLGVITFYCVSLNNGLVHTLFSLSTIAQVLGAIGVLLLEVYEVNVKNA